MIWFIIAAVVVVVCVIISYINENTSIWPDYENVFFAFVTSALIAAFVSLGCNAVAYKFVNEPVQQYTSLASLSDGSGVSGSFFLGIGSVDSEPVYMYYTNDNGVFRLHQIEARRAYVTYTDSQPQMVKHTDRSTNKWLSVFFGIDNDYEFQVPRGSVKSNFNLDAQ